MGSKQYTVTLTGAQRFNLYAFFFLRNGYQPKNLEQMRNLQSVCDAFELQEVRDRKEALTEGQTLGPKDFEAKTCTPGSVDLNNLLGYLDAIPQTVETALTMELLPIAEALHVAKNGRPLASVPEESPGA